MLRQLLAGRYQIISKLGSGAFGQTYLAEDKHLPGNPSCVVKQLQPQSTDPFTLQTARRLFDTEAKVLYRLGQHEQIPRLLAHFEENHEFYLVQEFIEGDDLSKELSPEPSTSLPGEFPPDRREQGGAMRVRLSEAEAITLLQEILSILEYVHQQNVIHRDIKPSNLIRRKQDGKLVLIDFGAVKQISSQVLNPEGEIIPTVIIGTQGYMSPEQLQGNPRCSSDIYALGMTAIQALTGEKPKYLPRDHANQVIWRNKVQVSDPLAAILDKMVRYDLRERYQSVGEVLNDLKKIANLSNALTVPASPSFPVRTANFQGTQASTSSEFSPAASVKGRVNSRSREASVPEALIPSGSTVGTTNYPRTELPTGVGLKPSWRRWSNPGYILAILAGVSAIFGILEFFQPTLRPIYFWHQGKQLLELERPKEALSSFEKMMDFKRKSPEAWKGRGDALYQLESYEAALSAYEQALQFKPNDPEALNGKGRALYQMQRLEEALDIFEKIIKIKPNNSEAWKGRGDVLYRLERYQAALAAYNKALRLQPNDPQTWNRKGRALYKLQRPQEALEAQEKALAISPDDPQALSDRGLALIGLHRYEEALAAFNKAQAIKPLDPRFWQNKALALQYLGRRQEALGIYHEALSAYDQTLKAKPNDATAWVDRGYVLSQLQRHEDALASYEKAIEIKPDFYLAWLSKGNALFPLRRYDEALAAFDKALEIRPKSYLTWHNRGSLLLAGKRNFAEAIKSFEKAIALNPSFYHAWRDRGSALSQVNRQKEAISSFDKALNIEPQDYKSWVGRGIALTALKRYREALVAFNQAIEIQPNDPFVWMNRGLALEKWRRYKEARESYKKAIEIDPKFQPAIRALEQLP